MSERELSKEESLRLITEMIGQAKANFSKGGSFHFLLWGWVVMFANLGHYLLASVTTFDRPYLVWLITIPAIIGSVVYSSGRRKKQKVITHLDNVYGQLWISIGVGIVIVLVFMKQVNFNTNAIILLFAAIGTYVSGLLLKFVPLRIGAIALWIAGVVCFFVPVIDQFLVGGIGILAGYIFPGYLLKRAENE